MNKKKNNKPFMPFQHEELEIKNILIDFARNAYKKGDKDAMLGSAMVYASFAEYLANHLLKTLRHLMYQTTYREFAAILFVDQRQDERTLTMGQKIGQLRGYEFPDKNAIVGLLDEVSHSRNSLFHNFADSDEKDLEEFDKDIAIIVDKTEELFSKINTVYAGLQKILLSPEQAGSVQEQKDE